MASRSAQPCESQDSDQALAGEGSRVVTVANVKSTITMVSNYWKEFDLEGLRIKLDEEGMQIADNQEDSVRKRRELAEATKEFKKKKDCTSKDVAALVKAYQEEIDRITKRAKFGEGAFLALYQKLYEAPDPAPALTASLESLSRTAELEAQTRKMAQELADYRAESEGIKNQEVTIKNLEETVRTLQASLKEREHQLEEAKQAAAQEADEQAMKDVKERESQLTSALSEAQSTLRDLKATHAATENKLFQVTSRNEEEAAGMRSQLEMAAQEMERAEEKYLGLQREKASLLAKMRKLQEGGSEDRQEQQRREQSLREELSAQRERSSYLQAEVEALECQLADERASSGARVARMREALEAQEAHSAALEQELACRPKADQLETLKQQVRALQAVGFSQVSVDVDEDAQTHDPMKNLGPPGSLEAMMLEKNRHLEHQLTRCKLELAEARSELEASRSQTADLEAALDEKSRLVEQLEDSVAALNSENLQRPGEEPGRMSRGSSGIPFGGNDDDGEHTMVAVVCQQRDRFRRKCLELEEAVSRGAHEVLSLRNELKAAQSDNVALIERMRFLQGYNRQAGDGRDPTSSSDVESRYNTEYEAQINPFSQFQARQKDTQRKKMSLPERMVYDVGSLLFGNKYARLFAFFYTILLHFMVFAVLFRMTHMSHHAKMAQEELCPKQVFVQSIPGRNSTA